MYEGITEVGNNIKRENALWKNVWQYNNKKGLQKKVESVRGELTETVTEILYHLLFDHFSSS